MAAAPVAKPQEAPSPRGRPRTWPSRACRAPEPEGRSGARQVGEGSSSRVLVLNSSYEPLNVCTVRRAVVLVLKQKAELLETGSRELRSESITFPHPGRDPAGDLRARPARQRPAQDHAPCRLRPRLVDLPVLRPHVPPDRRPRACRAVAEGRASGRTSSRPARRATGARATARRSR